MPKTESKKQQIVITSVRNLRKSIRIEWTEGNDEISHNFHDNPLPEFYKALDALKPHVCSLCELHPRDAEKLTVSGITVRDKGENALALVVARKAIKKGRRIFNIATPLLPMYPSENNKAADFMPEETAAAIETVISEAIKYLGGERAQGQIQFVEAAAAAEEEKGGNTEPFPELKQEAGT